MSQEADPSIPAGRADLSGMIDDIGGIMASHVFANGLPRPVLDDEVLLPALSARDMRLLNTVRQEIRREQNGEIPAAPDEV